MLRIRRRIAAVLLSGVLFSCQFVISCLILSANKSIVYGAEDNVKEERNKLNIGYLDLSDGIFKEKKQRDLFCDYIGKNLGLEVSPRIYYEYGILLNEASANKIDVILLNDSFKYSRLHMSAGVEAIAQTVKNGEKGFQQGCIFARDDSNIKGLGDMKNKKLALVEETAAGFILPLNYFSQNNISDIGSYFEEVIYYDKHEYACWAVFIKEADLGAAKMDTFELLARKFPKFKERMRILVRFDNIPSNIIAVRKSLDNNLKLKLTGLLLGFDKGNDGKIILDELGLERFIKFNGGYFQPINEAINKSRVGLRESSAPAVRQKEK